MSRNLNCSAYPTAGKKWSAGQVLSVGCLPPKSLSLDIRYRNTNKGEWVWGGRDKLSPQLILLGTLCKRRICQIKGNMGHSPRIRELTISQIYTFTQMTKIIIHGSLKEHYKHILYDASRSFPSYILKTVYEDKYIDVITEVEI